MASAALSDDDIITGINVTPLVDVTLVLLVILMVTASYVASRSIPMELPRSATSEDTPTTLTVSIDKDGRTFLDAQAIDEAALTARIRAAHSADPETRAVIAADGRVNHAQVVRVIDLLRREDVTKFAFNVDPDELKKRTP
jgi:biopolymer transport protein ExbD